jgi:hypothetical protein
MKPQPKPENGQHWRSERDNVVRRIVDASDPWTIRFENVVTGHRTKVYRASEWGRPSGYVHVPKGPEVATKEQQAQDEVHIRFSPGAGPRLTYCLKPLDARPGQPEPEIISTTLENLRFWRKRRAICKGCDARRKDMLTAVGEIAGAA